MNASGCDLLFYGLVRLYWILFLGCVARLWYVAWRGRPKK
jgi:hypothetical protein